MADRVSIANRWASSDVSSPSSFRTVPARFVATLRTWSLLDALLVAVAMTLPVTACVALIETA